MMADEHRGSVKHDGTGALRRDDGHLKFTDRRELDRATDVESPRA